MGYLDDKTAMDRICALLDGTEWDSDTASDIADIVQFTGRNVRDPEYVDDPIGDVIRRNRKEG